MRDIAINKDGDLLLDVTDLDMVSDSYDLAQSVRVILSTRLGEFKFDEELGLNQSNLFGKEYDADYLRMDISNALTEQEPRIQEVENIDFLIEGRELLIQIALIDLEGRLIKEEVSLDAE